MDQFPFCASHGFGGGGGSSGDGGLGGGGRMRPQRRGGWHRGWQRRGKLSSLYFPHFAVKGEHSLMLLLARLRQYGGIICSKYTAVYGCDNGNGVDKF